MIGPEDFTETFSRLTGNAPFCWQTRFYKEWFARGRIPSACDLPTGLGKTSIMALWLIARAAGTNLPRRLVYVVDRRAVVDQATRFAEMLRKNAVEALGIDDLPVSTLRGQFVDNRQWLDDPSGLAIIVGTVDMIGSRLLFSGYGVSRRMRPFHAGLLGADSLVLLDEAHLCLPFEMLLRAVAADESLRPIGKVRRAIVPGFNLLPLSATGRTEHQDSFVLEPSDLDSERDPVAFERFTASKHVTLHEPPEGAKLEDLLAEYAWQNGVANGAERILVYCDRRETAVKVKEKLDRQLRVQKLTNHSQLLVGARRVHERETLQDWLEEQGFLGSSNTSQVHPVFLVATSAGEVGVDLDADYMVCDLVPWERIVQRLGRVNRRGGGGRSAEIDIILTSSKKDLQAARLADCRTVLEALRSTTENSRDASPAAVQELKERARKDTDLGEVLGSAVSEQPLRPTLIRPLIEAWSLTTLNEHTGRPDVEPWLRGWIDDEPQVKVAWRKSLPWPANDNIPLPEDAERYLSLAPIHLEETLEAPTYHVFEILLERGRRTLKRLLDENLTRHRARQWPGMIVFDQASRFQEAMTVGQLADLAGISSQERKAVMARLHGRTLVVAADAGGLDTDGMLDSRSHHVSTLDNDWTEAARKRVGYCPVGPRDEEPDSRVWKTVGTMSLKRPEASETSTPYAIKFFVVRQKGAPRAGNQAVASRAQLLDKHHRWAAQAARELAEHLGLPGPFAEMLIAATAHHDLGKRRLLWQVAMNAPRNGIYGKTAGGGDGRRLNGYRHEFGSLLDVLHDGVLSHLDQEARDLALHVIASHHGFAHPTIPAFDPEAPVADRESLGREVALRFARLQRLWGPWGLAWWEALLRAADFSASRRLDEQDGG